MKGEPAGSPFLFVLGAVQQRREGKYLCVMKPLAKAQLPTESGPFEVRAYDSGFHDFPHLVLLSKAEIPAGETPLVRIHSECWTGDVVGSLKCDCGPQLDASLRRVAQDGGAVLYLRQEGRGIGLVEKLKAYNLQDQGLDTFEANEQLGHQRDARKFDVAAKLLEDLGWAEVRLMTNNPDKVNALRAEGIRVAEVVPIQFEPNEHNAAYLAAKVREAGGAV